MVKINMNELTKEQIQKAMACETAEELMAAAKAEGYELTKDEAEAYLTELSDFELDSEVSVITVILNRVRRNTDCFCYH